METSKKGYRKDLKKFFRSKMEANCARYYNLFGMKWQYESKEFEFKEIKRGTRYYKPDFYIPDMDVYVEIKGWFRRIDKIKLRRFKKYFPNEFKGMKFVIPDKFAKDKTNGEAIAFLLDDLGVDFMMDILSYKEMEKCGSMIPGWE